MRGKIYEQATQQKNTYKWILKMQENFQTHLYRNTIKNKRYDFLLVKLEKQIKHKKKSIGEAVLSGILIVAGGNTNKSTP